MRAALRLTRVYFAECRAVTINATRKYEDGAATAGQRCAVQPHALRLRSIGAATCRASAVHAKRTRTKQCSGCYSKGNLGTRADNDAA